MKWIGLNLSSLIASRLGFCVETIVFGSASCVLYVLFPSVVHVLYHVVPSVDSATKHVHFLGIPILSI